MFNVNFNVGFKGDIIKHLSSATGATNQNTLQYRNVSLNTNSSIGTSINEHINKNIRNQSELGFTFKVPVIDDRRSLLHYTGPDGKTTEQHIPETSVQVILRTCNNQKIVNLVNSPQTLQEFRPYNNPLYNYEIKYPKSWQIKDSGNSVTFASPQDYPYDKYLESLNIHVLPANSVPSLDQVIKQLLNQYRTNISNFTLLNSNNSFISGIPAVVLSYTYSDPSWDLTKVMKYVAMADDNVYIISYVAKPQYFNDKIGLIEQMLNSFKIKSSIT
jgi:hypothetical protein